MKVRLTGATGFIGKELVKELKLKNIDFSCLLRRTFVNEVIVKKEKLNYIFGGLEDITALQAATKDIDLVIHLAALLRGNDKTDLKIINVDGTKNLLAACKANNVKHFIFISSYLAMPKFASYYGKTKRIAEDLVRESKINYTILRPTMVYGRNDYYLSSISNLLRKLPVVPLPNFSIQPVHVIDVCKAILECIDNPNCINKEYFLAGPDLLDFKSFVAKISSQLSLNRKLFTIPTALLKPAVYIQEKFNDESMLTTTQLSDLKKFTHIDYSLASKDLNFNPISVDEGLKISI